MNAPAEILCVLCHSPIECAPVMKVRAGEPCALHPVCWERAERQQKEAQDRRIEHHVMRCTSRFENCARAPMEQDHGGLPHWGFAHFKNAEWRARGSAKIIQAVERYKLQIGNLLVSGPTGTGKTSAVTAWLKRDLEAAMADTSQVVVSMSVKNVNFAFISGHELVSARRNWKLGEESPIVGTAKERYLLILDELGFEPQHEVIFEVLDHRYRAEFRTIITTGLKADGFRNRYGDALYRRIAESGAVVEDW